jgi:hypothetical protein
MSTPKLQATLTFVPQEGVGGGFRLDWLDAKANDMHAGLDTGAGLGNPMFTFWIERKGTGRAYFECDIRDLFRTLIDQADTKKIKGAVKATEATWKRKRGA